MITKEYTPTKINTVLNKIKTKEYVNKATLVSIYLNNLTIQQIKTLTKEQIKEITTPNIIFKELNTFYLIPSLFTPKIKRFEITKILFNLLKKYKLSSIK